MPTPIPRHVLHQLRNDVPIDMLIRHLSTPCKIRDGLLRFLCPVCSEDHTATNPKTNLARCFRCARNFNPIDFVIASSQLSFLDAVRYLVGHRSSICASDKQINTNRASPDSTPPTENRRKTCDPLKTILRDWLSDQPQP